MNSEIAVAGACEIKDISVHFFQRQSATMMTETEQLSGSQNCESSDD
jgi:hypothetical protein